MRVDPPSIEVVLPTAEQLAVNPSLAWRTQFAVTISTNNDDLLTGTGDLRRGKVKVTVTAGDNVALFCNVTSTTANRSCEFTGGTEGWAFSQIAGTWKATQYLAIEQAPGLGSSPNPEGWSVRTSADKAAGDARVQQIKFTQKLPPSAWTEVTSQTVGSQVPSGAIFEGSVILRTHTNQVLAPASPADVELRLNVTGAVSSCPGGTGQCLLLRDETATLAAGKILALPIDRSTFRYGNEDARLEGLQRNSRSPSLMGSFVIDSWQGLAPPNSKDTDTRKGFLSLALARSCRDGGTCAAAVECSASKACVGGEACFAGLCGSIAPASSVSSYATKVRMRIDRGQTSPSLDPSSWEMLGQVYESSGRTFFDPFFYDWHFAVYPYPPGSTVRSDVDLEWSVYDAFASFLALSAPETLSFCSSATSSCSPIPKADWTIYLSVFAPLQDSILCVDAPLVGGSNSALESSAVPLCRNAHLPLQDCVGSQIWVTTPTDRAQVLYCPNARKLLRGGISSSQDEHSWQLAEEVLCFDYAKATVDANGNPVQAKADPGHFVSYGPPIGREIPETPRIAASGDFLCLHNFSPTSVPSGMDFLFAQERNPDVSRGELLRQCLTDVESRTGFLKGFLDKRANAFTDDVLFGKGAGCLSAPRFQFAKQLAGGRLSLRLLQQEAELLGFLTSEGYEEYRLQKVEEGYAVLPKATDGAPVLAEVSYARLSSAVTAQINEIMDYGLAIIQGDAADATGASGYFAYPQVHPSYLHTPDYRLSNQMYAEQSLPARPELFSHPGDLQPLGPAPILMEAANSYLRLVASRLETIQFETYEAIAAGGKPAVLVSARLEAGAALRRAMNLEHLSTLIFEKAAGQRRSCDPATDVNCTALSDGGGITDGVPWAQAWYRARQEYLLTRSDLVARLTGDSNPLGVSENDLPLFFGDLQGTNSRFFASSDYLMNVWAASAVGSAQASLNEARNAWISQRTSKIQDEDERAHVV